MNVCENAEMDPVPVQQKPGEILVFFVRRIPNVANAGTTCSQEP
jgi:hypothetical protein